LNAETELLSAVTIDIPDPRVSICGLFRIDKDKFPALYEKLLGVKIQENEIIDITIRMKKNWNDHDFFRKFYDATGEDTIGVLLHHRTFTRNSHGLAFYTWSRTQECPKDI